MEEAQQEAARELANKVPSGVLELDLFVKLKDSDLVTLTEDTLYEAFLEHVKANWSGSDWEQSFNDAYQPDEPIHEGSFMLGDGNWVKYRTSWLGGALNIFIFESPFTARTVACSPCVPNAGDLDNVGKGDYLCYDVPPDWRDTD